jgi:fatty-acid desaturase
VIRSHSTLGILGRFSGHRKPPPRFFSIREVGQTVLFRTPPGDCGGWSYLLWGIFLRTVVNLHGTWLVNSATHMWGSQRFLTGDASTNSFWVAILTFGEGWHNNHHAAPQSARHGLAWYEFDLNRYGICAFRWLGLAWDIKLPTVGSWACNLGLTQKRRRRPV